MVCGVMWIGGHGWAPCDGRTPVLAMRRGSRAYAVTALSCHLTLCLLWPLSSSAPRTFRKAAKEDW